MDKRGEGGKKMRKKGEISRHLSPLSLCFVLIGKFLDIDF